MNERRQMRLGYLRRHAGPFMTVGAVSVLGIVATALFHALTGRGLGPGAFGLLAAFLSIVNIAAIGASALQNSVAVATASSLVETTPEGATPRVARRWDGATTEAVVLGGVGALLVVVGVTAVLVDTTPARTAAAVGTLFSQNVALDDGSSVNLVVDPNRVGQNSIHLYLLDDTGQPFNPESIEIKLSLPSAQIGPLDETPIQAGPASCSRSATVVPCRPASSPTKPASPPRPHRPTWRGWSRAGCSSPSATAATAITAWPDPRWAS